MSPSNETAWLSSGRRCSSDRNNQRYSTTSRSIGIIWLNQSDVEVFRNESIPPFRLIVRLNSGTKNRHNFFVQAIFEYLIIRSDSVDHAESVNTNVLFQFSGNSICLPTQKPTQMFKGSFSMSGSQEIGSRLVSFQIIFEALKSELFSFKIHSLNSQILKIP